MFEAVQNAQPLDEFVICGIHEWGQANPAFPTHFIDVQKPNQALYLRGKNRLPVELECDGVPLQSMLKPCGVGLKEKDWEFPPEMDDMLVWNAEHADDEEQEVLEREDAQSVLSGQWRLSNFSYGSFSSLQLLYHTVHTQPVIQASSPPLEAFASQKKQTKMSQNTL